MSTPHGEFDELISASLTNDLTDAERARLDEHLAGCAACRATLHEVIEDRRLVSGLRHVAPPRELGARVRAGAERGVAAVPWWRRPATALAAAVGASAVVAGALLGLVLLDDGRQPPVGASPSSGASGSLLPSGSPAPSAEPSLAPSPAPTEAPTPAPTPRVTERPRAFLAYTGPFDNLVLTLRDGTDGSTLRELATPTGPPIAARLSPSGEWLAYLTRVGQKGTHEVRITRLDDGETLVLGESLSGSPWLDELAWSPDGRHLAFALTDAEGTSGSDAWVVDVDGGGPARRLTATGSGYVGSFEPDGSLWVSVAGTQPTSFDLPPAVVEAGRELSLEALRQAADREAPGAFQPLVSPSGEATIHWVGVMQGGGTGLPGSPRFVEGGELRLDRAEGGTTADLDGGAPLFSDLTVGRNGLVLAQVAWGPDGDAFAVWDAAWSGVAQSPDGSPYPDEARVYFSHASDPRLVTRTHAIDAADLPVDGNVVTVALGRGDVLAVTVEFGVGGIGDAPRAELRLVTRHTGSVPDEVETLGGDGGGWWGPAVYEPGG